MGITLKQLTDSLETVKTYVDNKAPSGGGSGTGDVYYSYEGYSEEEQVIGEYFGKPLYRKVMTGFVSIPALTSNSQDGYVITCSTKFDNDHDAYMVFDKKIDTGWFSAERVGYGWIQIELPVKMVVNSINIKPKYEVGSRVKNFEILASNDNLNFDTLYTGVHPNVDSDISCDLNNEIEYKYYRLNIKDNHSSYSAGVNEIELYIGNSLDSNCEIIHEYAYEDGYNLFEYTKTTDAPNSFTPSLITKNKAIISAAPYFEDYSEDEKIVGKWIDGKPLYRKVITGIITVSGLTTIDQGFINKYSIDNIVKLSCLSKSNDGSLNTTYYQSNYDFLRIIASGSDLAISCGSSYPIRPFNYIALAEYTKTTDTSNSFKPEMITSGIMADEPASDAEVDEIFN